MKFAHLADTHLGYRQYGLFEREEDFYHVFQEIIDNIIEERVDFVIHSGDLFEISKPSPNALLVFQEALMKLNDANIPIYGIPGNHDIIMRKNALPPQILFRKLGLKLISHNNPFYIQDNVFIGGTPYHSKAHHDKLVDKLQFVSKQSAEHDKRILVIHQGIDKYLPFEYELEMAEIPTNFNYYACGHVHNRINDEFGEGKLTYPGSTEIWKSNEVSDYKKKGKGFFLVDIGGDIPEVEPINVDMMREFIVKDIDYRKIDEEFLSLEKDVEVLKNKPVLNITISGENINRTDVYEKINEIFSKIALTIRPNFRNIIKNEHTDVIISNDTLDAKSIIVNELKHYDNEDITNLAIDLLNELPKEDMGNSKIITEKFFNDYFDREIKWDDI
ncbi:metallophosphoesterase family protein [Methanobrevibacter filiformis]|uniref:DNA double-strand break repair protein Mre11 n=1 Tax=Methanobrevibacter filiformis TaxID=55758 RepID=A0A166FB33_9EURY|nr:DNA repair exonuclease [Methanobrevibacter filiformis]KZX17488.1 putative metallophosphoesterase YhaO [Methanobrevibacter filiformis]